MIQDEILAELESLEREEEDVEADDVTADRLPSVPSDEPAPMLHSGKGEQLLG